MQIVHSKIPGCYEILPGIHQDNRGRFVKTFHSELFKHNHLEYNFTEQYYSSSAKGVLRGLHFQIPPKDHNKLVYCVSGKVIDVVVDLRVGSPTYSDFATFELSEERANSIYIPKGLAHGFCSISDNSILVYNVSTVYSPEHDSGIHWSSLDIPWPEIPLIISKRDSDFISFSQFESPFIYGGK